MDLFQNGLRSVDVKKGDPKNKLEHENKGLLRPFIYHTSVSGKNLREQLIHVLNYWMDVPEDKITAISDIVNTLHNISLLVDDIQDGAYLRRGVPAAYTIFGIGNVANTCTFLQLHIYSKAFNLNHKMALRIYLDAYLELLRGQGMELYCRENAICPTEEAYEQMVLRKTGGVFFLINNYMQLFARKRINLHKLLEALTLYYQINDDYMNLKSDTYFHNKGFCEDLTEGKFGYPIMIAVKSNPKIGKEIIEPEILKMRTNDVEKKKHCLSLIESCGSFRYTRDRLKILETDIRKEIEKLPENPLLNKFLPKFMLKSCNSNII